MTAEQWQKLFAEVKNYLDITWEDEQIDLKLTGILKRGMCYLERKAGATLDFEEEGQAKALLLDYVRYARANALDEFETNYLHELLDLHFYNMAKGAKGNDPGETPR